MAGYQRHSQRESKGSSVVAAICLTLFLFTLAVVLVLNFRWLYYLDVTVLGLDRESGMTVAQIRANYDALIRYNQVWHQGSLIFPTLTMSQTGAIHFREVKRIFDLVQVLCLVTGVISIVFFFRRRRNGNYRYMKAAGILALVLPAVLGLLAVFDWDRFFITFHRVFFRNNYWLFDSRTDPVILILPDTYFLHCAIGIFLLILLGSLLCFFIAGRAGRKKQNRK